MDLQVQRFSDIDLNDSFFDSLRVSYPEFNEWYNKKATAGATAYCYYALIPQHFDLTLFIST